MKWSGSVMFNSLQPHELYVACQAPPPMAFSRQEYHKIAHKWEQYMIIKRFSSVSVVSDSLRPHGLQQHTRPPCPPPTPGVYSKSCPLSRWCHPTISSSVVPFSSRLQSFPTPGSFPMSWFFASGGPSIGVSASTSVLPMNIQDWSLDGLVGLKGYNTEKLKQW